jgi:hypothetical protein
VFATIMAIAVLAVGGAGFGLYTLLATANADSRESGDTGRPQDSDLSTADGTAKVVVARLNEQDFAGLMSLTCASGRNEGRRALIDAVPALDPSASPNARDVEIALEVGAVVEDEPGEATAKVTGNFRENGVDTAQSGALLLLKEDSRWTLCGLDIGPSAVPRPLGDGRSATSTPPSSS